MKQRNRGGAPRKAPDGLNHVLFVRCDKALLRSLERLRMKRFPGNRADPVVTTSDFVRALLWKAIVDDIEQEDANLVTAKSLGSG